MTRIAPLLSLVCILEGCGPRNSEVELQLNDATYRIPKAQLEALVQDQGHVLVKVKSPDGEFKLTRNTRTDREQRETGKLTISGVNDQFGPYETLDSQVGEVICIDGRNWNCGFELGDEGVRWSVTFARSRLPEIVSIKQHALGALRTYRKAEAAEKRLP